MMIRTSMPALLLAGLLLQGCDRPPGAQAPEPEPIETAPSPDPAAAPASILRDDMAVNTIERQPLEPLTVTIPFAEGGSSLDDAAQQRLREIMASEQIDEGGTIVLRGHTDSQGHDEANLRASRRRAEAVRDALIGLGVEEDRFVIIPLGEMRPIAPNARLDGTPDEEGRARNRRVEVTIDLPAPADPAPADPPGGSPSLEAEAESGRLEGQ